MIEDKSVLRLAFGTSLASESEARSACQLIIQTAEKLINEENQQRDGGTH